MCESPVFTNLWTRAILGGENYRYSDRILSLPEGCTRIYIGNERLDLVGKLVEDGLDLISASEEVRTGFQLDPNVLEWVGKPGILFTQTGEFFRNNSWLDSDEFTYPIPARKRRLLRWFSFLPETFRKDHPDFFVSRKQYIPLN